MTQRTRGVDQQSWTRIGRRWGLALALLLVAPSLAEAQRGRSWRRLSRDAAEVLAQLDPVTALASRSVCELSHRGDTLALGTVVHEDGWLISKLSELAFPLTCELANGEQVPARLRGTDREHDLALLHVDAGPLTPIQWAQSEPQVGSLVVAANGRANAMAMGVVGGPARALDSGRPMLGVQFEERAQEARIARVVRGTTAHHIGLVEQDVIVGVNDAEFGTQADLMAVLRRMKVGDEIQLVVLRGDEQLEFAGSLGTWEEEGEMDGSKSRVRSGFPRVFHHDCVLDPRVCGGPLVDLDGRVVGFNIARAGRTASFAIPADTMRRQVTALLRQVNAVDGEISALRRDAR